MSGRFDKYLLSDKEEICSIYYSSIRVDLRLLVGSLLHPEGKMGRVVYDVLEEPPGSLATWCAPIAVKHFIVTLEMLCLAGKERDQIAMLRGRDRRKITNVSPVFGRQPFFVI